MIIILWLLAAYVIGSIPASLIVARLWKGIDIRQHGSGNPGATNVFRVVGPVPGVIAFLADGLKGFLPVFFAMQYFGPAQILSSIAVALAAICGHIFSIFLGFKGGKGVSTGAGVFFALLPLPTLYAFILFWIVVLSTGYVSLGSIAASIFLPIYCWSTGKPPILSVVASYVGLFIIYLHHTNISNLIRGKEHRFGRKKPPVVPPL